MRDYWTMTDKSLIFLAYDMRVIDDLSEFGVAAHNDFIADELGAKQRQSIIDELIKRDRHVASYIALAISILALVVSTFALLF